MWHTIAACLEWGVRGVCAAGQGSELLHRVSPRGRLLGARGCPWALPLPRGLGLCGERPEETHHLTGGEAERLMTETEGQRQSRESGPPGLYPTAQPLRLLRPRGGRLGASVLSLPGGVQSCPTPTPRSQRNSCPLDPMAPAPRAHTSRVVLGSPGVPALGLGRPIQRRWGWGGASGPRALGRGRVASRVLLGGAGAQGPRPRGPCPRSPPPWLSPGRGQEPGYLAGGSCSVGLAGGGRARAGRRRWHGSGLRRCHFI